MVTLGKKYKVLLVDDDRFLLDMYSIKFTKSGHTTKVASSSADALKMLKDGFVPDVIVLDIIMPSMDGLELLEVIRKEKLTPNTKVVMLTNQSQPTDIERATKLGVAGYIVKASTIPSEVVKEVEEIVARGRV